MKPKVIYYAHHLNKYNTLEELQELELIEKAFENSIIINPNGWVIQDVDESIIMEQCFKFVAKSDFLIFSSIEDGIIGEGIYSELLKALASGKIVYYLKDNRFIKFDEYDFDKIEYIFQDTNSRRRYAKIKSEV